MNAAVRMILLVSITAPTAVAAKAPPAQVQQTQTVQDLRVALRAMVQQPGVVQRAVPLQQSTPPGQTMRPVDPDQGDDHASARAIEVVCSKSTPAAQRSAICPVPVSPE